LAKRGEKKKKRKKNFLKKEGEVLHSSPFSRGRREKESVHSLIEDEKRKKKKGEEGRFAREGRRRKTPPSLYTRKKFPYFSQKEGGKKK